MFVFYAFYFRVSVFYLSVILEGTSGYNATLLLVLGI